MRLIPINSGNLFPPHERVEKVKNACNRLYDEASQFSLTPTQDVLRELIEQVQELADVTQQLVRAMESKR